MTDRDEKLVLDALLLVARAFRAYGSEIGAQEWPPYEKGKTEQYFACFTPVIAALVRSGSQSLRLTGEELIAWVMTQLAIFAEAELPPTNLPSDLLPIAPTYPWLPRTLFGNDQFRERIRIAIGDLIGEIFGTAIIEPSRDSLPQQEARVDRRHGFSPNMDRHRAIAAVVSRHAPQWRVDSRDWKHPEKLALICADLDQGWSSDQRELYIIPGSWSIGTPKSLRGKRVHNWMEALASCRKLVTDQIAASLNTLLRPEKPKVAREAENAQGKKGEKEP